MPTVTFCLLGFVLGVRHAFEPDHLVAVSALVAQDRGARQAAALGALWGVGHSLSLLAVGLLLSLVETRIPPKLSELFDLAVAGMLVVVGLKALRSGLARSAVELRAPEARQPLLIGIVRGLAGSGSLTALVVANQSSTAGRLAYIALFGAGLIASMALLSGVAGGRLARLARHPWAGRVIMGAAGAVSIALGVVWAYPLVIRFAD